MSHQSWQIGCVNNARFPNPVTYAAVIYGLHGNMDY